MKLSKCLFCKKELKKGLCRKFCNEKCKYCYRYKNDINGYKSHKLADAKDKLAIIRERKKYLLGLSAQELIDEVESRGDL